MFRMVYVSTATGPMDGPALEALLRVARANNARLGVTGVMLYHDGSFLQILEGPRAAVQALYARIAGDQRHGGVIQLLATPITERAFPDWQMGLVPLDDLDPGQRDGVVSLIDLARGRSRLTLATADRAPEVLIRSFLRGFRDLGLDRAG